MALEPFNLNENIQNTKISEHKNAVILSCMSTQFTYINTYILKSNQNKNWGVENNWHRW